MDCRMVVAGVILALGIGCSQPTAQQAPSTKVNDDMSEIKQRNSEEGDTTTADRPDFTLSVPSRWELVPSDEGYDFRNQSLPEQMVVTVLQHRRDLTTNEMEEAVTKLVALRRNVIAELSEGKAALHDTVFKRTENEVEARVIAEDAPNKVRLAFVIRATTKKTVTVALTRYSLDEAGTPFVNYARLIFDTLKIKNG